MYGKLYKVDSKWIVRYEDIKSLFPFTQYEMIDIPIHPNLDIPYYHDNEFKEGLEVFFNIVDDYAMVQVIDYPPPTS